MTSTNPPQFIFFTNESENNHCLYNAIQTAKYNSKHFAENIEITDYNHPNKDYIFNKTPQPYKTYIRLTDNKNYYVLEDDYHIEKFENERNHLIEVLGKLNAKSLDFQESVNFGCDTLCTGDFSNIIDGQIGNNKKKMDEMKQQTTFTDKCLTEKEVHDNIGDISRYPKKIRELIQNRISGVIYDNYSVYFNDYVDITGKLTDVLNMYLGVSFHRKETRKVTYEYKIEYHEYKSAVTSRQSEQTICKSICNHYPFSLCHGARVYPE